MSEFRRTSRRHLLCLRARRDVGVSRVHAGWPLVEGRSHDGGMGPAPETGTVSVNTGYESRVGSNECRTIRATGNRRIGAAVLALVGGISVALRVKRGSLGVTEYAGRAPIRVLAAAQTRPGDPREPPRRAAYLR